VDLAKAMEGVWEPGAGAEEPFGVGDVERSEGCRGNWRGPSRSKTLRGSGTGPPITGAPGKWWSAERESEGVIVVTERGDNITPRERRAPTSSMHEMLGGMLMSAAMSARTVRQADGLDPVRALQRVLYRSAKQDPERRFHALLDKVARSDVMWRAWVSVATNQGAPGIDGVSIAELEAEGVESVRTFLGELAERVRSGTYRPQPLRRVRIPKPGRPGQTRPLGIPAVGDRVVMAAAKIVLEPIFEADFGPVSFGFRPKRSAQQALEAVRVAANQGRVWVLDADIKACLEASSHCSFR
jgi:hypothetical protein